MRFKAVIFDLDGTLVSTTAAYRYELVGQVLSGYGKQAPNHHVDKFWFEGNRNPIISEHFGVEPDEFWDAFHAADTRELREIHTKPYPDTDVLLSLHKQAKLGIVTGAPMHILELEVAMLPCSFDAVVRAQLSSGITPKPHPHGLQECMRLLEVEPHEAVFVGNSDEDILCAQAAGVLDILVERGEHSFAHVKATHRIQSLHELKGILE